MYPFYIKQKVL